MDTQCATSTPLGPVQATDRIASIDVLRGVAVLGILVMNIQSFSMIGAAYMNPTSFGDLYGANYMVWLVCHILADRKFMTIFSLLYGAGIILMTSRCEASGRSSAAIHYRRNAILLVVGILHGYLLWFGDILHAYALCGFVVYLFRKKTPAMLILIGVGSIAVASGLALLFHRSLPHWPPENLEQFRVEAWSPPPDSIAKEIATYQGGWVAQLALRAKTAFFFQTFIFLMENFWRAGGLMLIGMAMFKLRFFSVTRSVKSYVIMLVVAAFVGLPLVCIGVDQCWRAHWQLERCFFLIAQYNYWGSLFVAGGWIAIIMLMCKNRFGRAILSPLRSVGRMALSNYLLQTVICTTIFYGHGFGLFGKVERKHQMLIVVAIWIFLIVLSNVWLRVFRFGPAEWVWRSLTYGKRQPMRQAQ